MYPHHTNLETSFPALTNVSSAACQPAGFCCCLFCLVVQHCACSPVAPHRGLWGQQHQMQGQHECGRLVSVRSLHCLAAQTQHLGTPAGSWSSRQVRACCQHNNQQICCQQKHTKLAEARRQVVQSTWPRLLTVNHFLRWEGIHNRGRYSAYMVVSGLGLCMPDFLSRVCKPKSDSTASSFPS